MPLLVPSVEPDVVAHLADFVRRVCSDPVFRRSLRYHPAAALAEARLGAPGAPAQLPVRHYQISVDVTAECMFGPSPVRRAPPPAIPLEVRMVRYALKPAALVHGPNAVMWALAAEARALGLPALLSPHEFRAVGDPSLNGYVNVAADPRRASDDPAAWRGLVVARDWQRAKLAWLALLFRWDEWLGVLLGYPACCARAFGAVWAEACHDDGGEVATTLLRRTAPPRPASLVRAAHRAMNLFARYFGHHLIEHFPCTLDCAATTALGAQLADGLAGHEPELGRALCTALGAPVLHAASDGTFLFHGGALDLASGRLDYDPARVACSRGDAPLARWVLERRWFDPAMIPADAAWLVHFGAAPGGA